MGPRYSRRLGETADSLRVMTKPTKALILCRDLDFSWFTSHLPDHVLDLDVLGESLWLHYRRLFAALGIDEVRILSETAAPRGAKLPETWPWQPSEGILQTLSGQRIFLRGARTLIVRAPVYFLAPEFPGGVPAAFGEATHPGLEPVWLSPEGRITPWDGGPWLSLTRAKDYHRLVLRLLATLPPPIPDLRGIPQGAILEAPVRLARGTRIARGCRVGPQTVLGPRVSLDRDVRIDRTILYGGQHLGPGVELSGKLVLGTSILTPENGAVTPVSDGRILKFCHP